MKRFLTIVALIGCSVASQVGHAADAKKRPNFLFIYTDDQRWDAMSVVQREQGERGRFPWFSTPNMDRLASEGIRFRNAFVTMSLCAPSRAAYLTSRYNHLNGVPSNQVPFPEDNVTYATLLRDAGYKTCYVGKWHMDGQENRPGFDFSASFVGQGKYFDCPILVNGEEFESDGFVDDVTTNYALNFMDDHQAEPFAMVVGFKSTHGPFTPPERAENRFEGKEARSVPNLTVPSIYKDERFPDGPKKETNLGYFRCLSAIDENIGRLLDMLEKLDIADNTVVVFTSDNGYYLGEHGLGDKRTAYEESIRIPMIVRWPGHVPAGATRDEMVLNIDIAPTFLDIAGVAVPKEMQGRSWTPLFSGKPDGWRDSFFYEYFREGKTGAPTVYAVRTETAKYVTYPGHPEWTEVFDLKADPYEIKNLAADPSGVNLRAKLEAEFEKQKKAVDFVEPAETKRVAYNEPRNAWVLEYRFDKDDLDKVIDASTFRNDGTATGTEVVDGHNGAKARKFDGEDVIEVGNPASIDPSGHDWTLELVFKASAPDGILLAHGGASTGYAVALEDGKVVMVVNANKRSTRVVSKRRIGDDWTTVRAGIEGTTAWLSVDGGESVAKPLKAQIERTPNNGLQIGDDLVSKVFGDVKMPGFKGLIESVRLYSGKTP